MQPSRYAAREQARWMRSHASLWVRPDATRFLKAGTAPESIFPALSLKYAPNQPRIPAGNPDGGQWTNGSGGDGDRPRVIIDTTNWGSDPDTGLANEIDSGGFSDIFPTEWEDVDVRLAQVGSSVTDADGLPYYARGGHHEMPRGVYEKWDLPPETRKVFNGSTTGSLPIGRAVDGPSGSVRGHYWNDAHNNYNEAVSELSERFLKERGLTPSRLSSDDARDLLREIRMSDDPRIRDFNRNIRLLRRIWRSVRGRE